MHNMYVRYYDTMDNNVLPISLMNQLLIYTEQAMLSPSSMQRYLISVPVVGSFFRDLLRIHGRSFLRLAQTLTVTMILSSKPHCRSKSKRPRARRIETLESQKKLMTGNKMLKCPRYYRPKLSN